ncbi:hypothetical protein HHL11_11370 [Ramlibacter sp. G-1-2-2]|uniref:Cell envelope biogenesis protein TolA n=1 Tax=Ramlibacter agri TaxID=2728837 RepID=A0A848H1A7_9BURK|nr:hypothetical protein [Ramlibacter agri]NML44354.1 hypothetical protein [Ramlibacter agri]
MQHRKRNRRWLGWGLALSLALTGGAFATGAGVGVGKDALKAAQRRIVAEREAKEDKAAADYDVAKARCKDARSDTARTACLEHAKVQRDAAVRQAKIERVESSKELKVRVQEAKKPKAPETPAARFAAEKARCELLGLERDNCLADARKRFNKA